MWPAEDIRDPHMHLLRVLCQIALGNQIYMATTIGYKHTYDVQNCFIVDKLPYVYAFIVIVDFDLSFISPITCSSLEMRKFAAGRVSVFITLSEPRAKRDRPRVLEGELSTHGGQTHGAASLLTSLAIPDLRGWTHSEAENKALAKRSGSKQRPSFE